MSWQTVDTKQLKRFIPQMRDLYPRQFGNTEKDLTEWSFSEQGLSFYSDDTILLKAKPPVSSDDSRDRNFYFVIQGEQVFSCFKTSRENFDELFGLENLDVDNALDYFRFAYFFSEYFNHFDHVLVQDERSLTSSFESVSSQKQKILDYAKNHPVDITLLDGVCLVQATVYSRAGDQQGLQRQTFRIQHGGPITKTSERIDLDLSLGELDILRLSSARDFPEISANVDDHRTGFPLSSPEVRHA